MKYKYIKLTIILENSSFQASAENTVNDTNRVLGGDNNSVTGIPNPDKLPIQIISGYHNRLVDTNASQIFGISNEINKSDVVTMGYKNIITNTSGNIYGSANKVEAGKEYGFTNVFGNGANVK